MVLFIQLYMICIILLSLTIHIHTAGMSDYESTSDYVNPTLEPNDHQTCRGTVSPLSTPKPSKSYMPSTPKATVSRTNSPSSSSGTTTAPSSSSTSSSPSSSTGTSSSPSSSTSTSSSPLSSTSPTTSPSSSTGTSSSPPSTGTSSSPSSSTSPSSSPSSSSSLSLTQDNLFTFQQTNIIREHHGLPGLKWNQELADMMKVFTDACPGYNHFAVPKRSWQWQNMAGGSPCKDQSSKDPNCKIDPVSAAWRWYEFEEPLWDYDLSKCKEDWVKCGHFVFMTQPDTIEIACGWTYCGTGYPLTNYYCNYIGTSTKTPKMPRPVSSITDLKIKLDDHAKQFLASHY